MILDKEVQMKVNNRTAKIYQDKGYDIPMRMGSHRKMVFDDTKYFTVKVEDLEPTSTVLVHTACDICGVEKVMPYREYYRQLDEDGLRTCIKCKTIKYQRTLHEKYGDNVDNITQLDHIKEKVKETNREKFGVDWCMSNKECQEKRRNTYLERYGCEWATQNKDVLNKTVKTNLEKYGVPSPSMVDEFKEKQKKTMMQKYGAEHPMRVPSIREKIESTNLEKYGHRCTLGSKEVYEKALKTKYKNGNVATSTQQEYICNLYNGTLNYPCSNYSLDIVLDNIDIEYDGGGHTLSVELGNISQHDFDVKQIVRDKTVKSFGYKIIRFISDTDRLPSDDTLLEVLDLSKKYFLSTNHSWIEWYFDKNTYRNADNLNGTFFDFGILKKVKSA